MKLEHRTTLSVERSRLIAVCNNSLQCQIPLQSIIPNWQPQRHTGYQDVLDGISYNTLQLQKQAEKDSSRKLRTLRI